MEETLEQKAQRANKSFGDKYREMISNMGYRFFNNVSLVGIEEYEASKRLVSNEEAVIPCIVVHLVPNDRYFPARLETVRHAINPVFKGFKVYVEAKEE